MKQLIAAVVSVLAILAIIGLVGGYEAELLTTWELLLWSAVCIYAEWWSVRAMEEKE